MVKKEVDIWSYNDHPTMRIRGRDSPFFVEIFKYLPPNCLITTWAVYYCRILGLFAKLRKWDFIFQEDILKDEGILLKSMIVTSELLKCFFGFADGVVCRRKFCLEFLDVELVWKWFISMLKIIMVDHSWEPPFCVRLRWKSVAGLVTNCVEPHVSRIRFRKDSKLWSP